MKEPLNWAALYDEFLGCWSDFKPPSVAVQRIVDPTNGDVRWLTDALRDAGDWPTSRKAFVGSLLWRRTGVSVSEVLFQPMLNAAIDEIDPSYNRCFVEPCINSFGSRRVNEYLLGVVESGTDWRKAGAVNALYWAEALAETSSVDNLQDVWERKRRLLLEMFVENSSVHVRQSIIPTLDLNPENYPDNDRALVQKAVTVARSHTDAYIRHRAEVQVSGRVSGGLLPLPHRSRREPTA